MHLTRAINILKYVTIVIVVIDDVIYKVQRDSHLSEAKSFLPKCGGKSTSQLVLEFVARYDQYYSRQTTIYKSKNKLRTSIFE